MSDLLLTIGTDISERYHVSNDILSDTSAIIEAAQSSAFRAINVALVQRNWLLGKRIAEEELSGNRQEGYGLEIIKKLSKELKQKYGKGFTKTNLYHFYNFFKEYPEIFHTLSGKSPILLSWSHYLILMRVFDKEARAWYEQEAIRETWSVRTLQRNVESQYYYRLLQSQVKDPVQSEMHQLSASHQDDKLEFIKNPMIVEFLGLSEESSLRESKLEASIITNLQKFLMELGKGYAFVARQQHIHTEKEDYYIDLVFYNYILKCFVLIDLKTTKITHQDVGQMEKKIITAVRYRVNDIYFVDGCEEEASTGNRDYWLGKTGSAHKKYLFSCKYKGQQIEEKRLREQLNTYFQEKKLKMA